MMDDLKKNINNQDTTNIGYKKIATEEKAQWVRHQFDSVAKRYDLMNTLLSFGIHYIWKQAAIDMLDVKPGHKILDVCGGTGDLSISAAKLAGASGQVVLYDINSEMMLAGRGKTSNAAIRRKIHYVQGDAEQMALPDNYFDRAIVGFGIRNLTHMQKGFEEMFRVLKPGGIMICLEFSRPSEPLFKYLYDQYSFWLMPWLGGILTGSMQAYVYLTESIRLFPPPDKLADILKNIGFKAVKYRKLTNGVAVIHQGVKSI